MGDITITVVRDYDGEGEAVFYGPSLLISGNMVPAYDLLVKLKDDGLLNDQVRVVEHFTYGNASEYFD